MEPLESQGFGQVIDASEVAAEIFLFRRRIDRDYNERDVSGIMAIGQCARQRFAVGGVQFRGDDQQVGAGGFQGLLPLGATDAGAHGIPEAIEQQAGVPDECRAGIDDHDARLHARGDPSCDEIASVVPGIRQPPRRRVPPELPVGALFVFAVNDFQRYSTELLAILVPVVVSCLDDRVCCCINIIKRRMRS